MFSEMGDYRRRGFVEGREKMIGFCGTCWSRIWGIFKRILAVCSRKQSGLEIQI